MTGIIALNRSPEILAHKTVCNFFVNLTVRAHKKKVPTENCPNGKLHTQIEFYFNTYKRKEEEEENANLPFMFYNCWTTIVIVKRLISYHYFC